MVDAKIVPSCGRRTLLRRTDARRVWFRLNLAWVGFFVVSGIANLLVAPEIDPLNFQFSEGTWVDFKLFGLLGLTIAFVFAQALYLSRYVSTTTSEAE